MPMADWICRNTTMRRRPFSFEGYEFQTQIASDLHPDLNVIKCSQVGLTEVEVRKFLGFLRRNNGTKAIFTLPDEKMFRRVSQTRIRPILDQDRVFNLEGDDKAVRSISLIQIGDSFGYVVGNTEGDATSIDADVLFHDELDLSNMQMIGLFQSRMQNSNYKITQKFSTPTLEGFGIDSGFNASDGHEYMIRCVCNHWQIPDFDFPFLNIPGLPSDLEDLSLIDAEMASRFDLKQSYVRCEKCLRPLDLGDPSIREWVPRHPGRLSRGYRVRPFCTPRLPIDYILRQLLQFKQQSYLRGWYNTVLGKSFTEAGARLTEQEIKACMRGPTAPVIGPEVPVFVGIDVGLICHLVLGCPTPAGLLVFHWEQIPADILGIRISQILDTYQVVGGAIDRHPQTTLANEIYGRTDKRIIPLEYRGTAPLAFKKDELGEVSHAQGNRTNMIDKVASGVRKVQIEFTGYGHQERVIIEHLRDMVRDEMPDTPAEWKKITGNDHYFHALALLSASMRLAEVRMYLDDADPREMYDLFGLEISHQNAPELGFRLRRTETFRSGHLYGGVNR